MQAFLCRQLLVVVLLNTVPPPCVQGQELNDFRGVVQQAHDATFEKYTKNLDLEVVEEFYERTGTDSKIYKRYYHTYTSSARRWKLLSRAQDDPPYPIKVLTGSREGIYCLTIADASGTGKLSVREPNGPDMYHTICRADMGIAPQLAYFEGSIHSYLALPDMKVEKVSPEVWDGVTLTCATVSRPLKGGIRQRIYFDKDRGMALIGIRTLMEKTGVESVCKTTYAPGPDCVPTLWEYDSVDKATGKHFPLRKLRYTKYERNSRTDEEFSLRQYGLPDPVGVTLAKPFPTYLILLLSAAAPGPTHLNHGIPSQVLFEDVGAEGRLERLGLLAALRLRLVQ